MPDRVDGGARAGRGLGPGLCLCRNRLRDGGAGAVKGELEAVVGALQLLGQVVFDPLVPRRRSSSRRLDAPLAQRHCPVRAPVLEAAPARSVVPEDEVPAEQLDGRGPVLREGGLEGDGVPVREPVEGGAVGLLSLLLSC